MTRSPDADPPLSGGRRLAALSVGPLVLLAWALFAVFVGLSNAHTHRESSGCAWLPIPWTIWAAAYGGLTAAVAAVSVPLTLRRRTPRSAVAFAAVGWFAVVALGVAVVLTHLEAGSHEGPVCGGLVWHPAVTFVPGAQ
ncbi:hypothetical protein SRB5_20980 [Streptomyces sp. RB5]|uniref:Uncharacterized protein n=1 Tax=Streptomyces smaragdinus TaxID=2585196 RepID=A0A7K0CES1_9ACTN|nr:hypothetical protein [Streptomyces smaragdinus]MQY11970.1 hypothetical protein [Streptomyces smaragdinus]